MVLNTSLSPWPSFSQDEINAVTRVLSSNKVNYWTGQEGREFEKEFAQFSDCQYAVAVANGTLALDLALHALAIGHGDEVIVTSRTFIASVSCIVNAGATPVFADVELDSQNISARTISQVLSKKTKAIICVHLAGLPCDMDEIMTLAEQHNLYVIEDCAQAHGAKYQGRSVGSIGHVGAWSFCQDKIMTTGGEGGMLTTNDKALWQRAWAHKDHGKSFDTVYHQQHPPGFRWLHESFGTNWRLTEMQSAIGRLQLKKMSDWTSARQNNAKKLSAICREFSWLTVPKAPENMLHAYYKFYAFIQPEQLPKHWSRDKIMAAILNQGIPCYSGSCSEVYKEKAFDHTGFRPARPLNNARQLGETALMFLVHPSITGQEISHVCEKLMGIFSMINKEILTAR